MGSTLTQIFPPKPTFTDKNVPDQTGKVFIVTGSSSGVGLEVAQILYAKNAKVYIAARSAPKAEAAISSIKTAVPKSRGSLIFLNLDLSDLRKVKQAADEFLSKETKLDVLWNNAGVAGPPQGSVTAQGYELQLGSNTLGPFLFTQLLTPLLRATAKTAPPGSVRVVWVASSSAELIAPKGGVDMGNLDYRVDKSPSFKYGVSKAGMVLLAKEYARREGKNGILSIPLNPGNLKSELQRHMSFLLKTAIGLLLHDAVFGAYTELFAGLSPSVTPERNGAWVVPWGRFLPLREDLELAALPKEEGGTGNGLAFWEWSEQQVKPVI